MKKYNKSLSIVLVLITIIMCTTGCGILDKLKKAKTPKAGEKLEEVQLYDEEMELYTAETLPDEYKMKDFDGDRLSNKDEINRGTDIYKVDTDDDGLSDWDELEKSKTDPLKWSSRDDKVSDLEFYLTSDKDFEQGYTSTDANGLKVYLDKPEDRLYIISKVSTNTFDELDTISESFKIKYFSGKIALNCSKYEQSVADSISIYKDVNGKATKIDTVITEDRLIEFNVNEDDIFVIVYTEK